MLFKSSFISFVFPYSVFCMICLIYITLLLEETLQPLMKVVELVAHIRFLLAIQIYSFRYYPQKLKVFIKNYWAFRCFPSYGIPVIEISSFIWGRKQIQFPKRHVFYSLEYRTMEKVQKPSNSMCYTPLSEPFRIYKIIYIYACGKFVC
jgi:hypothetical protein